MTTRRVTKKYLELQDLIKQRDELDDSIDKAARELRKSCKHKQVLWEGFSQAHPDTRYCIDCGTIEESHGLPFSVITTEWGKQTRDYHSDPDRFPGPHGMTTLS